MSRKFVPIKAPTRRKEIDHDDDYNSAHGNTHQVHGDRGPRPPAKV
jgi:hypothetical protein